MDSSIVKKTQDTLGKVISKPPLTEKLLSKPPFRFLHDVITEVVKKTHVLKGLFKQEELNSENVKEKDAKIAFLQKAIDCVGMLVGESLAARPTKIVAGHEPEKTNEFLQALGKACLKKMDSTESVKRVLAGEKPSSGKSRKKETTEKRSSSKERSSGSADREKGKESQKRDEKESKKKDADSSKGKKSKDERERSSAREKEKEKEKEREKSRGKEKMKEKEDDKAKEKDTDKEPQDIPSSREDENGADKLEKGDEHVGSRSVQRPASAKGQRRRPTNQEGEKENMPPSDDVLPDQSKDGDEPNEKEDPLQLQDDSSIRQQSAVRRMARPSSARPAPPKIKKNTEIEDTSQRLGSGKQFNAVIVDNPKDQDDDDDLFVVEENLQNEPYFEQVNTDNQPDIDDGQHGSLVKKMLDSKRDADIIQSKTQQNNEKPLIMDATRKKEKELAQKEIEKLRNSIQILCRSAHPLGKVMDYLQEDIDSMQKELEMWQKENRQHSMALKAEQSITESETEPLQAQLGELELEITDMIDKISSVKSNIVRNDEKIRDLVSGISR